MSNVRRVYVEKKEAYAVKAKELQEEIKSYLGITSVTGVRVLIRYDVENISEATYQRALVSVFSEPPVDDIYEETFDLKGAKAFSVEFLPGQFDQRADSALLEIDNRRTHMSYADHIFINMCKDIIENGTSTEGEKVRPKWEDGTSAYTIKQFGVVNRYDLSKEFPALTLRRTAIKSCTDEMLWIWQQKSNNINDLHSHVWDEWADETGSIGKAYGYQMGVKHQYKEGMMDQVDRVIYDLKNNPYSRRIMTNIYVHADLHEMHLYPCAYSMTFNVTKKPGQDKLVLNAILNQRSQDILAANNWNVCQYAVLMHMLAQVCDMQVGELVHVIADAHIYDRHIPLVKELISREPLPAPTFWLNPEVKDFYRFTRDDVRLDNYQTGPQITNIPIAV